MAEMSIAGTGDFVAVEAVVAADKVIGGLGGHKLVVRGLHGGNHGEEEGKLYSNAQKQ